MSIYESRKATFLQREATSGPSRKKAGSGSKSGWPHPFQNKDASSSKIGSSDNGKEYYNKEESAYPSPRSMANLGLYYDPTSDVKDRCTVFPDGHTVSDWKEGDTALDRLSDLDPTISWVMIETSRKACEEREGAKKYSWSQEDDRIMPTGKAMIDARYRTYAGAWPLDGKKGWKPTSKKLSSAGFHFNPNEDEEDCVTCAYCQCSLGGWEKADDPVKEHQKRKPDCAIFTSVLEKKQEAKEAPLQVISANSGKERTTSKKRVAEAMQEMEGEEASSSRSRSKRKQSVEPQVTVSEQGEGAKPVMKKKKKATAKAKKPTKKADFPLPNEKEKQVEVVEKAEAVPELKPKKASKKAEAMTARIRHVEEEEEADVDEKMMEASNFEEEPSSRSPSRDTKKITSDARKDSPPTSCGSETFKSPKQTVSARVTEKTLERVVSPVKVKPSTSNQKGDIPPLYQIEELTSKEKAMTVEEWLKSHIKRACKEMKEEGNKRIVELEREMIKGRFEAERILRGVDIHQAD
ncbi:hypothetical protein CBS101457_002228 [Exobasidium rhododendri]|nr:hypothetical protein CBS101457_002228 [Exobasidium rhododendri]